MNVFLLCQCSGRADLTHVFYKSVEGLSDQCKHCVRTFVCTCCTMLCLVGWKCHVLCPWQSWLYLATIYHAECHAWLSFVFCSALGVLKHMGITEEMDLHNSFNTGCCPASQTTQYTHKHSDEDSTQVKSVHICWIFRDQMLLFCLSLVSERRSEIIVGSQQTSALLACPEESTDTHPHKTHTPTPAPTVLPMQEDRGIPFTSVA